MDNLLEFIVPLIFAAIYFFGNMLSGKSDADDKPKPLRRRETPEDAEAAERQRKIQEEIRRKIMERRQAAETAEPVRQMSAYDEQQRERRRALEAAREQEATVKQATPPPVRRQVEPPPRVAKKSEGGFSWDASDDIYESQMAQQLKRIEATKQKAEKLKKQAKQASSASKSQSKKEPRSSRTFSGPIRSQLKDPAAARAAFIYGEVLGQPVSERKQSSVPGLS